MLETELMVLYLHCLRQFKMDSNFVRGIWQLQNQLLLGRVGLDSVDLGCHKPPPCNSGIVVRL